MSIHDDYDDYDDDGLPDAAFTEDELAAGIHYLARGDDLSDFIADKYDHLEVHGSTRDSNWFKTFQEASNWAKENPGGAFVKSPKGDGYIVKEKQGGTITKTQNNVGSVVNDKRRVKKNSFENMTKEFRTNEYNHELLEIYWTIFKKKWRLLIDFCINYRNELKSNGLYQSIEIKKTDEISSVANDLVSEFLDACSKIGLYNDGLGEIETKLLTLTGDRMDVSTQYRHVVESNGVKTYSIFSKRDTSADFIFSEASKDSKEKQYSEYLGNHMLYILIRAIPVNYSYQKLPNGFTAY